MPIQNPLPTEQPHRINQFPIVPWWKVLLFVAMLIASSVSMFKFSIWLGAILFLAALLFHTYGGFGASQQISGETRFRVVSFVVIWSLVIIFSALSQFFYPAFVDLFSSFGGDLPGLAQLIMDTYPALLLLPIAIGFVWAFWPVKAARLRVATRFGWFSLALMLMAVASLYLPIIKMSMAV